MKAIFIPHTHFYLLGNIIMDNFSGILECKTLKITFKIYMMYIWNIKYNYIDYRQFLDFK